MPRITEAELQADGLLLRWDNERQSRFPWFWLRDHGQDPASLDPTTLQRRVDTFALDEDVQGSAASVLDEGRSEAHTSELQSLMRISYAVFCLKKKKQYIRRTSKVGRQKKHK